MKISQGIGAMDAQVAAYGREEGTSSGLGTEGSPNEIGAALGGNALTPAQARTALELIDSICPDTWCSGDYDFRFQHLACDRAAATCSLTLQVFSRDGEESAVPSDVGSCETSGFEGFGSLVEGSAESYQFLTESYYAALTECTTRILNELP